ncbi:hypothetical protein DIC66_07585 [Rhodoferax lacus]|uniref:YceI family protein n=1 Tax=Rhodoferax lacus TaxID=2184758 RepID=A0A3E1REB0_9BURK|nr:hypothetical protein [Rhodoferax lacus]RFO97706.1 hypothetical protein DIC66_07585 [Rhodoferax lacus]
MQHTPPPWIALCALCCLLALPGCSTQAPRADAARAPASAEAPAPDLDAVYGPLIGNADARVYRLNPEASVVRIYAFRGGGARQFGHNHVLSAPLAKGFVALAQPGRDDARFDLEFRLEDMEVDKPEQRSALGEAFASAIGPAMVASTRENMLGEFGLQAGRYPLVHVASLRVVGEMPKLSAQIAVDLHGQRHTQWVALTVAQTPTGLQVQGALVLLQTDFGLRPFSMLGGLLAVQDPLVLEFVLQAVPVRP